ncbi:MAG: FG-GAP repeat protein [Halobacteriaceae archaeon]
MDPGRGASVRRRRLVRIRDGVLSGWVGGRSRRARRRGPHRFPSGVGVLIPAFGSDWAQHETLVPKGGDSKDCFGAALDVSRDGSTVLVGAQWGEDPNGGRSGSAYAFG